MTDPLARNDWIGTREDKWSDILPQSWQSAINTNPVVNALARYMAPRQSFDQSVRDWQDSLPGNSPIDRIADGRSSLAREYPKPMSPFATEALDKAGFLANFVAPGGVKLPPPSAPKPQGIKAYHGSPHDFDRFDISKIGTGEGAQAYGRGLYFAENEGVAKSYRDALAPKSVSAAERFTPEGIAGTFVHNAGGNERYALRELEGFLAEYKQLGPTARLNYEQAVDRIKSGNYPRGRMYEVNIKADPDQFLDWDKPLSQQPEAVRKAYADALRGLGHKDPSKIEGSPFASSGEGLENLVNTWAKYDRAKASSALRDAGIPGIRYKDAMSRDGAGPGTSNYVVFDAALIDILRKYGLLPPVAAGAAQAATQGQDTAY